MAPELFAVSYAGAPKIVVTDFVDEVRISASRRVEFVGEGRGASSPSDEVGGGLIFDFEVIRTVSDTVGERERAAAAMASSRASTRLHRRSPRPSTGSRRRVPTTSARKSVAVSLE